MSLIDSFLTDEYKVKVSLGGYYRKGIWQSNGTKTITVKGSMQPLNAREIKFMPEGERLKAGFKFYTDQPISPIDTKILAHSNIVTIDDETYKVISVEKWQGLRVDLPHYKSILVREPEQ